MSCFIADFLESNGIGCAKVLSLSLLENIMSTTDMATTFIVQRSLCATISTDEKMSPCFGKMWRHIVGQESMA